jgi:hypothetical protein
MATVRDAQGNLASCWDGAKAVPCQVDFWVPSGTRAGDGGGAIAGPAWVTADAGIADYGASPLLQARVESKSSTVTGSVPGVAATTYRGQTGSYAVTGRVNGQDIRLADGLDWTPAAAEARFVLTDPVAPSAPVVDPSDGSSLTGQGSAGDTITVKDKNGNVLCSATVGDDLHWSCQLKPAAKEGDILTVVEENPALGPVERLWRVGLPLLSLAKATVCGGQGQSAGGVNFQPAEEVTLAPAGSTGADGQDGSPDVSKSIADGDGRVTFRWTVPSSAPPGEQSVSLSGPLSGQVTGTFEVACSQPSPSQTPSPSVTPSDSPTAAPSLAPHPSDPAAPPTAQPPSPALPFTGSRGMAALAGTALGVILAGWLLIWAARRRRQASR